MSSKDKDHPLYKLKQFFQSSTKICGSGIKERDIWPDLEADLSSESPVINRCKTLIELGDFVLKTKLEDTVVKKLWDITKDLIVENKCAEHRQVALTFYRQLIQGQYNNLTIMREHFFLVIQNHNVKEDLKHRLELLIALTENGKDISNFEERIGRFMMDLVPAIVLAKHTALYLEMLANIIKFNAAHLDNEIVVEIVQSACNLCCSVDNTDIGLQCLKILELVMCYTIFPNETLTLCVMTLCRTVNNETYCQTSWKNMKNLLGTNLGYASLLIMCNILNDKSLYEEQDLLRGAIFHTNMGIFGSVAAIQQTPRFSTKSTVLTSFLHALDSRKVIVTYEVILSMHMMIPKYGAELPEHIWDIICDIFFALADNIRFYESNGLRKDIILQRQFHETIDTIETMLKNDEILANPELIYDLIEKVSESRSEISVLNLIDYRSSKITAARPEWLLVLYNFIKRFYSIPSTKIRVKIIQSLVTIMEVNRDAYEEEILERVVIPVFAGVASEPDIYVRTIVSTSLVEFVRHCDTKRCGELLNILEGVLNRPFDQHGVNNIIYKTESELTDIMAVVEGLINVFLVKLYRLPSCHAIRIYQMLIGFMETHYELPKVMEQVNSIRRKIFSWMLKARANSLYRIGYPDLSNNGQILFSQHLGIDSSLSSYAVNSQQPIVLHNCHETIPTMTYTTISIRRACKIIVIALDSESDYNIFQLIVKELPIIMQNKALIQGNDIEALANVLFKCRSLIERTFAFNYIKPTSDEYNALLLPATASLITYHQFLPPHRQLGIMEALKSGIFSRIANICINALTIMILEMPEIVMRKLHEVLLQMSKMSDTVIVANPVLEFLSILSHLPNHMFADFVPVQYMYIFAISLPYTKPHRYQHYTVFLAHHVIAKWFLKCKLGLRKNCVNYIISSIQSNASLLLEDLELNNLPRNAMNEDSSNRKRSTSLTERGSRTNSYLTNMRPLMNANIKSFHSELAETCIDFLARHTYSPCSSLPKRLPAVDNILKDGPSQTWLVGHNLITITTNGCSSAPSSNGLCVRCASMGKSSSQTFPKVEASSGNSSFIGGGSSSSELNNLNHQKDTSFDFPPNNRRYTKASLQYSSGTGSSSTDLTSSTSSSSQAQNSESNKAQRQTSNSSSGSLEALSRRGSNPDSIESRDRDTNRSAIGSSNGSILGNSLNQLSAASSSSQLSVQQQICARSCTGWAEVFIRRPTGNISWVMRIQNPIINDCIGNSMPFNDLISLFLPTQHGGVFGPDFINETRLLSPVLPADKENKNEGETKSDKIEQKIVKAAAKVRSLKRQEEISSTSLSGPIDIPKPVKSHVVDQTENFSDDDEKYDSAFDDDDSRSRNPVRRVNSSPEMSSSWRTTFLAGKQHTKDTNTTEPFSHIFNADKERDLYSDFSEQQLKKKSGGYAKDMRVSCEAIPEEIAGSTPPSLSESLKESHVNKQKVDQDLNEKTDPAVQHSKEPMLPPKQHSADDVINQTPFNPIKISSSITNLKMSMDLKKPTSKPLQSTGLPAPLSPRLLVASLSSVNRGSNSTLSEYGAIDKIRGRSKTISVVREVNSGRTTRPLPTFRTHNSTKSTNVSKLGINPSFVFLQLFHTGVFQVTEEPLKVPPEMSVSLDILDLIPPFETHKIGVLYVGPGQCNNEVEILKNRYGSTRYVEFIRNIGTLISLKDSKENNLFINMETNGRDGNFTYIWKDDIAQVTFHVATLMPNNINDTNCNEKKKHIGNDYVSIVYNESGEEYKLNTIKGQFSFACVVVQPLELNTNRIIVRVRPEISNFIGHPEPMIVSNRSAPLLARQLALHADLAAHVYQSLKKKIPYESNRLERLRRIKNLRIRLINEDRKLNSSETSVSAGDVSKNQQKHINCDFTKYTS